MERKSGTTVKTTPKSEQLADARLATHLADVMRSHADAHDRGSRMDYPVAILRDAADTLERLAAHVKGGA